jgi:hypothetical protein
MTKIQETLNSLQPYLIGIRYLEGTVLVDVVLKNGWSVIETNGIKAVKGDESLNYYMFFSESPKIGLDELLANVRKIINLNIEKEKKQELLNNKIIELKKLFRQTDLKQLGKLKFTFGEDEISHNLYEEDENIEDESIEYIPPIIEEETKYPTQTAVNEALQETYNTVTEPIVYLDENKQPIELTEEEREMLEEEARAERNIMATKNRKKNPHQPMANVSQIELPPKTRTNNKSYGQNCDCGPEEACGKCIDSKGY